MRRTTTATLLAVAGLASATTLAVAPTALAADNSVELVGPITLNRTQADLPVTASINLRSTTGSTTTVDQVAVAVRDASGNNLDFPGLKQNVPISTTGSTYTSKARAFAPGSYDVFVAYATNGQWTNLPKQTMNIWSVPAKHRVFPTQFTETDQFSAANGWYAGRTGSYMPLGNIDDVHEAQYNTDNFKLDCISPDWSYPRSDGTFEATPISGCSERSGDFWKTDFVTTRPRYPDWDGFKLRPGDSMTAVVTVSADTGSWPGIWTWSENSGQSPDFTGEGEGHGEVDPLEHHGDQPTVLEMSNLTIGALHKGYTVESHGKCPRTQGMVKPNEPFGLQVDFDTDHVTFWINGKSQCVLPGVPADWRAYLNVNLSVDDGTNHPRPPASRLESFTVKDLTIWQS